MRNWSRLWPPPRISTDGNHTLNGARPVRLRIREAADTAEIVVVQLAGLCRVRRHTQQWRQQQQQQAGHAHLERQRRSGRPKPVPKVPPIAHASAWESILTIVGRSSEALPLSGCRLDCGFFPLQWLTPLPGSTNLSLVFGSL